MRHAEGADLPYFWTPLASEVFRMSLMASKKASRSASLKVRSSRRMRGMVELPD